MRYAVISDTHGNYPALRAVLGDAEARGTDAYIFSGDYCLSFPYPDECVAAIRNAAGRRVVRGNEESYLTDLRGKDQRDWTDGQMQITYWGFRNLSADHLRWLSSLPRALAFEDRGVKINVAHASSDFIGDCEFRLFGPLALSVKYAGVRVTPEYLAGDIGGLLRGDPDFQRRVNALDDGVYIFGHSHVQWTYRPENRNVYLINPGSCGLPLDGVREGVPYAAVTVSDNGEVETELIRVPFDKEGFAEEVRASGQYAEAGVWSRLVISELTDARERVVFFLRFAGKYAEEIGDPVRPFSVSTWEKAYEQWIRDGGNA